MFELYKVVITILCLFQNVYSRPGYGRPPMPEPMPISGGYGGYGGSGSSYGMGGGMPMGGGFGGNGGGFGGGGFGKR
uniref:Uncharacterized protein n=1 Tax=Strongyloides stercoralis TaxID=6248 RepID=A0A0K0E7C6_STRER